MFDDRNAYKEILRMNHASFYLSWEYINGINEVWLPALMHSRNGISNNYALFYKIQ